MKDAVFQSKCRRCGMIVDEGFTNAKNMPCFLIDVILGVAVSGIPQTMISMHTCNDGSYGVTDLIGVDIRDIGDA